MGRKPTGGKGSNQYAVKGAPLMSVSRATRTQFEWAVDDPAFSEFEDTAFEYRDQVRGWATMADAAAGLRSGVEQGLIPAVEVAGMAFEPVDDSPRMTTVVSFRVLPRGREPFEVFAVFNEVDNELSMWAHDEDDPARRYLSVWDVSEAAGLIEASSTPNPRHYALAECTETALTQVYVLAARQLERRLMQTARVEAAALVGGWEHAAQDAAAGVRPDRTYFLRGRGGEWRQVTKEKWVRVEGRSRNGEPATAGFDNADGVKGSLSYQGYGLDEYLEYLTEHGLDRDPADR